MKVFGICALGLIGGIAVASLVSLTSREQLTHAGYSTSRITPGDRPAGELDGRSGEPSGANVQQHHSNFDDNNDTVAEANLRSKVEMLERGAEYLRSVPDYSATINKREVVGGTLLDEQQIFIKCRHDPFSVYLLWKTGDVGREVIFIDGANDGKMIAHDGGWKARIPALSLSPNGILAMRDARYPVTKAGLNGLLNTMLDIHKNDLRSSNVASCEIDDGRQFEGRPCTTFTTKYKSSSQSPEYRKSITLIDQEWSIPVYSRHFEWPKSDKHSKTDEELDKATLIESYSFTHIKFGCGTTDHDFDKNNPNYHFH